MSSNGERLQDDDFRIDPQLIMDYVDAAQFDDLDRARETGIIHLRMDEGTLSTEAIKRVFSDWNGKIPLRTKESPDESERLAA